MSVKTLRYYDRIGLLLPDEIDRFTGYRYYSAARLADCYRIAALKELGFSLEEIHLHMSADSKEEVINLLDAKTAELKALMSVTESRLNRLDSIKQIITEGYKMFDIIVRNSDTASGQIRAAYIRQIFNSREEAYAKAKEIRKALPKNLQPGRLIIINYETEYREEAFDLAACVEINGKPFPDCGFVDKALAFSGETASLICKREELDEAYRSMWAQLNEKNVQITGAFYELYHDERTVELKVPVCSLTEKETAVDSSVFDFPFENDPVVIGKWEYLDRFPSEEQFNINSSKDSRKDSVWLKELYFLPEGEGYWIMDGWTKGSFVTYFYYPTHRYRHYYTVREVEGKKLLFVEMKDDYYRISHGGKPEIYVYQKVSDKIYTKSDIAIRDNVDFSFEEDKRVLGRWISVDFVFKTEDFDPLNQKTAGESLYVSEVEFLPEGKALRRYKEGNSRALEYTRGKLLDKWQQKCEEYEFKIVNGLEYLFIQWKSGDYVFGGRKPWYYVFKRVH